MEFRDDFAGADRTWIIDDPNARALTNQFAGVVSGKLGRYPANQEQNPFTFCGRAASTGRGMSLLHCLLHPERRLGLDG
jgi:hypothetical protein